MSRLVIALVVLLAVWSPARAVNAQTVEPFALDRFEPTPAGDRFFAVPGAELAGHGRLVLGLVGDYAYRPLVLYRNDGDERVGSVVSDQLFLHVGLSIALFDRLQFSLNAPVALVTTGDSPESGGVQLASPSGAAFGDLRFGMRLRVLGEARGPAQLALGGSLFTPTGEQEAYASDGKVRGRAELILSGEGDSIAYALQGGLVLRPERSILDIQVRNEFVFGAALGFLALDRKLQVGPELSVGTTLEQAFERDTLNAEAILGLRYRASAFVLGAGAGPGIGRGLGTPTLRALLGVAYAPEPVAGPPADRDQDGIPDLSDACPDNFGVRSKDARRNGCPDTDADGIFDEDDACVEVRGVATEDPATNGCPPDRDRDGVLDSADACPDVPGVRHEDAKKNGCPPDRDGDGILDAKDDCPDTQGIESDEPGKNGCPPDTDGDGIADDEDACPRERGKRNPDPKKNGCPTLVRVTEKEIVILQTVEFKTASAEIQPVSDELLQQVAEVLQEHPEIKRVEVQGHTDNRGAARYNQQLSERRAASVVKWLATRGRVDESRLTSKGFGKDVPIADNTTDDGRQANRRVEFKIVEAEKKARPIEQQKESE